MDNSPQNLQDKSFKGMDLQKADFCGADVRGADFTGANLENANFSGSVSGLRRVSQVLLFTMALVLSLLSGYFAMLAGRQVQLMIRSEDKLINIAGYVTVFFAAFFFGTALWKGVTKLIGKVFLVMIIFVIIIGLFAYFSGLGTGLGALQSAIALLLMLLMFIVGTIARATAGTLASNVLFILVAIGGGMFGKSMGGGIGTVIMALACAVISKKALKDEKDASVLRYIALYIGTLFGTSFKNANLANADFSNSTIKNTNFMNANVHNVNWSNANKQFTIDGKP
jgi:hypothetical protein